MRRAVVRALAGALAAAAPLCAAGIDPAPVEWLHRCADRIDAADERSAGARPQGIVQMEAACPGLTATLDALGLGVEFDPNWREHIDGESLDALADMLDHYESTPLAAGPDVAALAPLAQTLRQPAPPRSLWERFKAWVHALLEQPADASARPDWSWLQRLLHRWHLSPGVVEGIGYGGLAAVIGAALWLVWRELRLSGLLRRRARRAAPASPPAHTVWQPLAAMSGIRLEDLASLPATHRAGALLALLVQALCGTGRLGAERALTHGQLVERARLDDEEQRRSFERVARLAERQLYGPADAMPQADAVLTEGIRLYRRLRPAGAGP